MKEYCSSTNIVLHSNSYDKKMLKSALDFMVNWKAPFKELSFEKSHRLRSCNFTKNELIHSSFSKISNIATPGNIAINMDVQYCRMRPSRGERWIHSVISYHQKFGFSQPAHPGVTHCRKLAESWSPLLPGLAVISVMFVPF